MTEPTPETGRDDTGVEPTTPADDQSSTPSVDPGKSDTEAVTSDASTTTDPATQRADTPASHVADRYGTTPAASRSRRRMLMAAIGVLVLLAGLGVAYVGWSNYGPEEVAAEQLGYTTIDDSTIDVRIKVTRQDPQQPVVCILRAMDADIAEVGRREVLVQGSPHGTVELTTTIRTSGRASSGTVYTCSDNVPEYLRSR